MSKKRFSVLEDKIRTASLVKKNSSFEITALFHPLYARHEPDLENCDRDLDLDQLLLVILKICTINPIYLDILETCDLFLSLLK